LTSNSIKASTGFNPFNLNYGRHPHTPPLFLAVADNQPRTRESNPAANDFVDRFKSELACVEDALHRAQERQRKYADLNRRHAFFFGDYILLSTQHITLKVGEGSTPKLCPRFIGPFQVVQVLYPVAYKLKLPSSMKCHPVFHISLLRPADTESALFPEREQPAPPPVRVDNNQAIFTIDYIMGHEPKSARSHEEARKYLIKWEGYPLWEATKEPAKYTQGCPSCCSRLLDQSL
jgi:hypothetical protein